MKGRSVQAFSSRSAFPLVYHDPTSCFLRQRQFGALTKRARKSGSQWTRRWRGMDSNFRYRGRRPASGRSLRAQRVETDAAKREFGSDSCLFSPPWGGSGGLGGGLCFPFPTPGNGQQESRLAPIGRHLRLLRRGVLRTGCFPRQAAFQGGHEIDDGWRGRDLPGFNGEAPSSWLRLVLARPPGNDLDTSSDRNFPSAAR